MMKLKMKTLALPMAFAMAFGVATLNGTAPAEAAAKTPEQLAKTCKVCHPKNPKAGDFAKMTSAHIADMLRKYRSGEVKGTMMNGLTKKYTDEQIDGLAALLGTK